MNELAEAVKTKYIRLRQDKKLMSGIYIVTLVTALLVLALVIKGPEASGQLIADESGNVTGISRRNTDRTEKYDLSLRIEDGRDVIERDVTLNLQADRKSGTAEGSSRKDEREASVEAGINSVISEIEYSKGRRIDLPDSLPDGTAISWSSSEKKDNSMMLIIASVYTGLIALMIAGSGGKDKTADQMRKSILKGLPRFCNQLFLMMNAGLILSDAFDTITGSYGMYDEKELSAFEKELAELGEATDGHRRSTAEVINEYAVKHDVKELIRIASILTENEKRGSDVIESLARESRYLWDERKTVARESGKMIDTKMAYPLGLLLVLLIVITMAPALLGM